MNGRDEAVRTHRAIPTAAVAVAAAGAMLAGGATAANAAVKWDHHWHWGGQSAYVKERGDIIKICDIKRDGNPAFVSVLWGKGHEYDVKVPGGYGKCITHRASQGRYFNPREGAVVRLSFWNYEHGKHLGNKRFLNDH